MTGLEVPWSIAFTSPARMLVTERPGRVRVVENGVLRKEPLATLDDVEATGETGLMGLALAPDYATSRLLYLSYAHGGGSTTRVRVEQFRDEGARIVATRIIVDGLPARSTTRDAGFGSARTASCTSRRATRRSGRSRRRWIRWPGKTLRVNPDGSIPADNPFPRLPDLLPGAPQLPGARLAAAVPGLQFQTEHGPSGFDGPGGGDEVNIVEAGKNYGWPIIHHRQARAGLVSPLLEFTPAIAPAGASFVHGGALPGSPEASSLRRCGERSSFVCGLPREIRGRRRDRRPARRRLRPAARSDAGARTGRCTSRRATGTAEEGFTRGTTEF